MTAAVPDDAVASNADWLGARCRSEGADGPPQGPFVHLKDPDGNLWNVPQILRK